MDFRIEENFDNAKVECTCCVVIKEKSYLIVYGKYIGGYFCCVPNWNWGCEMEEPHQVDENVRKLIECGANKEVAEGIANAIRICFS